MPLPHTDIFTWLAFQPISERMGSGNPFAPRQRVAAVCDVEIHPVYVDAPEMKYNVLSFVFHFIFDEGHLSDFSN